MAKRLEKDIQELYPELRPTVYWWAKRMENRLRLKDKSHKHGWLDGNLHFYIVWIFKSWKAAVKAIQFVSTVIVDPSLPSRITSGIKEHKDITNEDVEKCIKKCIDGANFFMMLADNLRNILLERGIKVGGRDSR